MKHKIGEEGILWDEDIMPICKVSNWVNMGLDKEAIEKLNKGYDVGIVFSFKGETIELHLKPEKKK